MAGRGDVRRARRVVRLAAGWAREPGASIPRLSQGQATPEALQAPHRQVIARQLLAPGTYLLVEDTTELSWPQRERPTQLANPLARPPELRLLVEGVNMAAQLPDE